MKFVCFLLILISASAKAQINIDKVKAEILFITKLTDKQNLIKRFW